MGGVNFKLLHFVVVLDIRNAIVSRCYLLILLFIDFLQEQRRNCVTFTWLKWKIIIISIFLCSLRNVLVCKVIFFLLSDVTVAWWRYWQFLRVVIGSCLTYDLVTCPHARSSGWSLCNVMGRWRTHLRVAKALEQVMLYRSDKNP